MFVGGGRSKLGSVCVFHEVIDGVFRRARTSDAVGLPLRRRRAWFDLSIETRTAFEVGGGGKKRKGAIALSDLRNSPLSTISLASHLIDAHSSPLSCPALRAFLLAWDALWDCRT